MTHPSSLPTQPASDVQIPVQFRGTANLWDDRAKSFDDPSLLKVTYAADVSRFSLRIDPQHLDHASQVMGLQLPSRIGGAASDGSRTAICLGPDEWFLIAPVQELERIEGDFASLYATAIHSLVDISHREVGIEVSGSQAAFALQSVIGFDVAAMPVGSGCRTLLDKVQVIMLRNTADNFRIEVWRSFSDHVWHLLQTIRQE